MTNLELTRRSFVVTTAAAGGGLMLGVLSTPASAVINPQPWMAPTDKEGTEISQWLAIDPEGVVTIRVPHTEQGQGALTSVPMMINEELMADWSMIRSQYADVNRHVRNDEEYVSMITHGSLVVRSRHPHLLQAGASARERLKTAAATAWGVDVSLVSAKDSVLSAGNRSGTYGEFASAAAQVVLAAEPTPKSPDQFQFLGASVSRLDIPLKVNGSAQYTIDTRLPGMVYAAIQNSPTQWGGAPSFDFNTIKDRPGVIAAFEFSIKEGTNIGNALNAHRNAVAVVADSWYRAKTALELMPVTWGSSEHDTVSSASLMAQATAKLDTAGDLREELGADPMGLIAGSTNALTADYFRPYETHARMEPINAVVSVTENRCDAWTPCNNQANGLAILANELGMDPANVYVHTAFLGGAYGGGGGGNTAVTRQAAQISAQLGRPVKLVWTREEDIMHDTQRDLVAARLSAAIGPDGLPLAFFSRTWSSRDSAITDAPYAIPNRRHERHTVQSNITQSTHRAPGTNQNTFIMESFADEMAVAGGWDPLDWRIKLTEGLPSESLVWNTLKEVAGFTTDLPRGEGMGVAGGWDHGTYCAACATVTVSRRGQLRVEKVVHVLDSGHIINPLNCAEQSEGAAIWELSHAWLAGLDLQNGRFTNNNFDTYQLMRIGHTFEHELHFALSGGEMWGGMGEPSGPPTPGAVANAIFFATGKRIRTTPFKNHDLSWS